MAKALPYFKWYAADAETDANFRAMDDTQRGFYLRCLNHTWLNGSIPADPAERARMLHDTQAYADRQWVRVGKCFQPSATDPTQLVNKRQEEERQKAISKSNQSSDAVRVREEKKHRKKLLGSSDDHRTIIIR